jgi:hypothetical protein
MVQNFSLKSSHIEIWIFQTTSDEEITKTKVADLEELYKLVVDNFFI